MVRFKTTFLVRDCYPVKRLPLDISAAMEAAANKYSNIHPLWQGPHRIKRVRLECIGIRQECIEHRVSSNRVAITASSTETQRRMKRFFYKRDDPIDERRAKVTTLGRSNNTRSMALWPVLENTRDTLSGLRIQVLLSRRQNWACPKGTYSSSRCTLERCPKLRQVLISKRILTQRQRSKAFHENRKMQIKAPLATHAISRSARLLGRK